MRRIHTLILTLFTMVLIASAQNPSSVTLRFPNGGETFRPGSTQELRWDTAGTFRARWRFLFATSMTGPWTALTGPSNVLDSGATRGQSVPTSGGWRVPNVPTSSGYIKMELIADPTVFDINDNPFTIATPETIVPDSIITGEITRNIHLRATKIYGLQGYVYVNAGATLTIDPGTIIVGDVPGNNSALVINRGAKIVAQGTAENPIVFTSRAAAGQRARGDWGGILICGKARVNQPAGQAALEGGVADLTAGGKGWYGGTDDDDNSGILKYVRIEFAGIATQPNSELNSLTMGGVGRGTTIENVQVSYGNDDGFEWFGGTVNGRYLISYGILDDDFDCDNGFSGRVQFGLVKRFRTVADVSTSQAFEIDNDASGSFNAPRTQPLFSNFTVVGPLQDTSWTPGSGTNQYSSRYGAAAQIRRASRASIVNTVFVGWPRGFEIAQAPTMVAANNDSLLVRSNSWYGIKGAALTLASGTPPAGMDANWLAKAGFNNEVDKGNPNAAFLVNAWVTDGSFNARPLVVAPYLSTASFANGSATVSLADPYLQQVSYRGAFPADGPAWDAQWAEYDPINKEYRAQPLVRLTSPGSKTGEKFIQGEKITISWDTSGAAGNSYRFQFGASADGPWQDIPDASNVLDAGAGRGTLAGGFTAPNVVTKTGYVRMSLVNDPATFDISDNPIEIAAPVPKDPAVKLLEPGTNNKAFRVGQSVDISWDTTNTFRQRWRFEFGKSANGPWSTMPGLGNVLDSATRRGRIAGAVVFRPADLTQTGYIRMVLLSDTTKTDVNDNPFTISAPAPIVVDSILEGEITKNVKLSNTKIYGLKGYVYVNDGATLEVEKGTIVVGDEPGNNSALVINRGGKIIANGTAKDPIIFTSRAVPGQRARGDWGGILICGKARINQPAGQAALEGGVADQTPGGKGWYGGTDNEDNSGILKYVRIEFAGIATQPNSELNSLTMGGVGRGTTIENVQVSYGNDDGFEWFGGTVNAKYLISTGILDDDFDTDNGFSGKVQFAVAQRFRTVADVSTSQVFESDNDAQSSYNQPLTSAVFSNVTGIGPVQDTSWTPGSGANQYSSRFGAAAQIRRNSRQSIHNSVFIGWPRGFEFAQVQTLNAAMADSIEIRNNAWYGVKGAVMTLAGGTPPAGMDVNWIAKPAYGNVVDKSSPNPAMVENAFATNAEFNPAIKDMSPLATGAAFAGKSEDSFFERVAFRGAFGLQRWDAEWSEYDPVNKEYKAKSPVSVDEETVVEGVVASAYPNPSFTASTVRYVLGQDDVVSVRLATATGEVVSAFFTNQAQRAGTYEFNLVTADLASGIYYLTITGVRGTVILPISVAH